MQNTNEVLNEQYWNNRYNTQKTGWDLREVSPPLKEYINQLTNKNLRILIPGCGNTYEAAYLLQQGFTNVTVIDIAQALVEKLKVDFNHNSCIKIIHGDFFDHAGEYDLILEQTFFCAIHPSLRKKYVAKMNGLLAPNGKLAGVLFNREFEEQGPPFGGNEADYKTIFEKNFELLHFSACFNSHYKRKDTELFINLKKRLG